MSTILVIHTHAGCRNYESDGMYKAVHISMQVLSNPFNDIVPRDIKKKVKSEKQSKPKSQSKATK